jgi:hypothetical protein
MFFEKKPYSVQIIRKTPCMGDQHSHQGTPYCNTFYTGWNSTGVQSKVCTVSDRSNARIVGSTPAQNTDECQCFFLRLRCSVRPWERGFPVQGALPNNARNVNSLRR